MQNKKKGDKGFNEFLDKRENTFAQKLKEVGMAAYRPKKE